MNVCYTEQSSSSTEFNIQMRVCFKVYRKIYFYMSKYLACPGEKLSIYASVKSSLSPEYLARETRFLPAPYLLGFLVSIQQARSPQFNFPFLFPLPLFFWTLSVNENRKALFSIASEADHVQAWPCAALGWF